MNDVQAKQMPPHQARHTRRSWRLPLSLILGLLTWWGVGNWLEPRPLWEIPFQYGKPAIEPLLEDPASRWLLASDSSKDDVFSIATEHQDFAALTGHPRPSKLSLVILDAKTGRQQSRITICDLTPEPFPGKRARLLGDSLWWFNTRQLESEQRLELHRWKFTQDAVDKVVKSWSMPSHTPIHVAFAEADSGRFMIQSTVPWELELVSLATSPWSLLTNMLVPDVQWSQPELRVTRFGNSFKENDLQLQTLLMPMVSTYALPLDAQGHEPSCLAKWTLPSVRWNIPVIGKDLQWLAWSDCKNPRSWSADNLRAYGQPTGVLLFDGLTGNKITLQSDKGFADFPQACFVMGNYLATESLDYEKDHVSKRLFDPGHGVLLPWSEAMKDRLLDFKRMRVTTDEHQMLFIMDHFPGCLRSQLDSYQLFDQTNQALVLKTQPQVPPDCDLSDWQLPLAFAGNQLAFVNTGDMRPAWVKKVETAYPQAIRWAYQFIDAARSSVIILQAHTGELLITFPGRREAEHLSSTNQLYMIKTKLDLNTLTEQILALEAWSFPLSFWSPWWGRLSGIIVFLLLLCCLRKSTSSLHAC